MRGKAFLTGMFLTLAALGPVRADGGPIPLQALTPPPPPPVHPAPPDSTVPGAPFLVKIKAFVDEGDLQHYTSLAYILGAEAVIKKLDDPNHPEATTPSEVALKPLPGSGPLPSANYTIHPPTRQDARYAHYQPPYHALSAEIWIGNAQDLSKFYCVTREDAVNAFGASDMKGRDAQESYDHKFDHEAEKGYDIYVNLYFGTDQIQHTQTNADPLKSRMWLESVKNKCAKNITLSQYDYIRRP